MTKQTEAMKLALEAYMAAGFGNSTDFALQRKAYDLALQALAEQPAQQQEPVAGKKSHTSADNYGASYETSDRAPFTDGDPSDGY